MSVIRDALLCWLSRILNLSFRILSFQNLVSVRGVVLNCFVLDDEDRQTYCDLSIAWLVSKGRLPEFGELRQASSLTIWQIDARRGLEKSHARGRRERPVTHPKSEVMGTSSWLS